MEKLKNKIKKWKIKNKIKKWKIKKIKRLKYNFFLIIFH